MKQKSEIVKNWLPRYTDTPLEMFGKYILLTNFISYVQEFARQEGTEVHGIQRPMQTATSADGITIVNFGIGSPNAATICDLLSAVTERFTELHLKIGIESLRELMSSGDSVRHLVF